jgi:hypothetical protein
MIDDFWWISRLSRTVLFLGRNSKFLFSFAVSSFLNFSFLNTLRRRKKLLIKLKSHKKFMLKHESKGEEPNRERRQSKRHFMLDTRDTLYSAQCRRPSIAQLSFYGFVPFFSSSHMEHLRTHLDFLAAFRSKVWGEYEAARRSVFVKLACSFEPETK